MMTFRRILILSAILAFAVPARAGQNGAAPLAADPAKSQVRTFELALRSAVETGTRNFAQRASEMVPELFSVIDAAAVDGVAVHVNERTEYVFHIQVPTIWPVIQVMHMMNQRSPRTAGPQAVADGRGTPANRAQADEELAVNASNRPELEREYAMKVRDALVDAILDNSSVLPLSPPDTLVVFASGSDAGIPQSLYQAVPRKLILSIGGSDLTDMRQGKITRAQAKLKVIEEHF
jgi:hypothetical protein